MRWFLRYLGLSKSKGMTVFWTSDPEEAAAAGASPGDISWLETGGDDGLTAEDLRAQLSSTQAKLCQAESQLDTLAGKLGTALAENASLRLRMDRACTAERIKQVIEQGGFGMQPAIPKVFAKLFRQCLDT